MPQATQEALKVLGWTMAPTDGGFGRYACIQHSISQFDGHKDRVYSAASEMRANGVALA